MQITYHKKNKEGKEKSPFSHSLQYRFPKRQKTKESKQVPRNASSRKEFSVYNKTISACYKSFDFSLISSKLHLLANAGISFGTRVIAWNREETLSNTFYSSPLLPFQTHPRNFSNVVISTNWKVITRQMAYIREWKQSHIIEQRSTANELQRIEQVNIKQSGEEGSLHFASSHSKSQNKQGRAN